MQLLTSMKVRDRFAMSKICKIHFTFFILIVLQNLDHLLRPKTKQFQGLFAYAVSGIFLYQLDKKVDMKDRRECRHEVSRQLKLIRGEKYG